MNCELCGKYIADIMAIDKTACEHYWIDAGEKRGPKDYPGKRGRGSRIWADLFLQMDYGGSRVLNSKDAFLFLQSVTRFSKEWEGKLLTRPAKGRPGFRRVFKVKHYTETPTQPEGEEPAP